MKKKLYFTPYTDDVENFILEQYLMKPKQDALQGRVLLLTPTMFLYRRRLERLGILLSKESKKESCKNNKKLEEMIEINQFDQWVKDVVYRSNNQLPLSKSESHVILKRIISDHLPGRREWLSVSLELLETFFEFDTTNLTIQELRDISPYSDWKTVIDLYELYGKVLSHQGLQSYGERFIELLLTSVQMDQYEEVLFDGPFLFMRSIHEAVIQRFEKLGKNVSFIVPFQEGIGENNPAFNVIKRAYEPYVPIKEWISISKRFTPSSTVIEQLRNCLFTNQYVNNHSSSLSVHSHGTVEEEIRNVLQQAKQAIDSGETTRRGIIIVTPDAMQMRPLVREIAEQEGLQVDIPTRPFLGLTSGEFVKLIYKSKWEERRLDETTYMDSSMFKRILNSGWFKGADVTLEGFQAIENVFFSDCLTIEAWEKRINQLLSVKKSLNHPDFPYHPIHAVANSELKFWKRILNEIQSIHDTLVQKEMGTVQEQAQLLLEVLQEIAKKHGFIETDHGNQVMDRIQNIIYGITTQNRIAVSAEEFSQLLYGLMVDIEESKNEIWDPHKREVIVTGPENVAYLQYKYMYLIQFTQEQFPRIYKSKWPIHSDIEWKFINKSTGLILQSTEDWEELLTEREKYYFYLAFYVPNIDMQISYSRTSEGERVYPSHYLFDVARAFRIEEKLDQTYKGLVRKTIEELLEDQGLLHIHQLGSRHTDEKVKDFFTEPNLPKMQTFNIDELAIYRLCPRRFYYMKHYPTKSLYTTKFQLERYIAAVVAERTALKMFSELSKDSMMEQLEQMNRKGQILFQTIPAHIKDIEGELYELFPVERQVWEQGMYYAKRFLENIVKLAFDENQARAALKKGVAHLKVSFKTEDREEIQQVNVTTGSYLIVGRGPLSVKFGSMERTFFISHYQHMPGISSYELPNQEESFSKWFYSFKRGFFSEDKMVRSQIAGMIEAIEQGDFVKKVGEHCSYCPFLLSCQKNDWAENSRGE